MSGPVQLIPPGLLSFFGVKTLGRNPDQLIDNYQPSVEMLDWLMGSQAREANVATLTVAAGGFQGFSAQPIVVPALEWWWLSDYTVQGACGAADTMTFAPCAAFPQVTNRLHLLGDYVTLGNNDVALGSGNRLRGWFVPPTTILGVHIRAFSGVTCALQGWLRFTPLPV